MRTSIGLTIIVCVVLAPTARAETSKEYAVMGRAAWSAFSCSTLASQMKDAKEAERLFMYGYKQGQAFIGALQSRKIERKDISEEVPFGVTLQLQGPTLDFVLGRVFEVAQEEALKNVLKTSGQLN